MFRICLILLYFIVLAAPVASKGQGPRDIAKVKTQILKYDTTQYPFSFTIPFKTIEVIDYRFDTSKIGYATYRTRDNHTKLIPPGGAQEFLNRRLNTYFKNNLDPASTNTLVIVLKKLWLEYGAVNEMLRSKDFDNESILGLFNRNSVCLADIDVFAKSDTSYRAVVRLTQNFVIDQFGKYSDYNLLLMPFDSLVSKIQSMDMTTALANKKKFSFNDIYLNYNQRFNIPVLFSDSLNRGIFLSFNDFKNNKPSYPDFKYKRFELSTEITILQDGKEVAITDYWGFADGRDLYIKPRFLSFRVMRQGNTFDLLGAMGSKSIPVVIPLYGGAYLTTSTVRTVLYPFQVDMETGKVY